MKDHVLTGKKKEFDHIGVIELLTDSPDTNTKRVCQRENISNVDIYKIQEKYNLQRDRSKPLRTFRPLDWYLAVDNSRTIPSVSDAQVLVEYQKGKLAYQRNNPPEWAKKYLDPSATRLSPVASALTNGIEDHYARPLLINTAIKNEDVRSMSHST